MQNALKEGMILFVAEIDLQETCNVVSQKLPPASVSFAFYEGFVALN